MKYIDSLSFAREMDRNDPLRSFRKQFIMPSLHGKPAIYLCGNSLGLQPRSAAAFLRDELNDWGKLGVEGHIEGKRPWLYYHHFTKPLLAAITGAKASEVVAMQQLTVNLHLMMMSFYRPSGERNLIIAEAGAFSSDQYAFESQILLHGLDPAKALIEISPRPGEHTLRLEDITNTIRKHGKRVALVIFGGVQYYTGQFFNLKEITAAAHEVGAFAGFDLAHAVGNVPLNLHNDQVDFAVWCSYKYLNSGPGSVGGAFVHEKHAKSGLLRLAGWWGHNEKDRFQMKKGFIPMPGVDGWQLSNFPVFSGAVHLASLEIFKEAGMKALRKKSMALTGYLDFLIRPLSGKAFTIITPADPESRGCQLSLLMHENGRKIFDRITREGVIADWRSPNVIRAAPAPMYNTFTDVYRFAMALRKALESHQKP